MTSTGGTQRPSALAALGTALVSVAALTACSAAAGSAPSTPGTSSSSAVVEASPSPVQASMGTTAATPTLSITVTEVQDEAAPNATQPTEAGTHWATAAVKECATADTQPARFTLTLADGSDARETPSWPDGLPTPLIPSGEGMPSGQCAQGLVYFVVPDGASIVDVVAQGSSTSPTVTWPVVRAKATH